MGDSEADAKRYGPLDEDIDDEIVIPDAPHGATCVALKSRIAELEAMLRIWRDYYSRSPDGLTITIPAYHIENLIGKK